MVIIKKLGWILLLTFSASLWSAADTSADAKNVELSVWVNEAIVATYHYDYKNFLARQREIAKYYTADGWSKYITALKHSGLMDSVTKNAYYVSAVAQLPPTITKVAEGEWQASMPVLVVYKNPAYKQKQILQVDIRFAQVPSGQGQRGLAINNLQSKVIQAPCECSPESKGTAP